jgi:hypothetical protein
MSDVGKVILHIGLHKTATGALQRQFFPACVDLNLLTTAIPKIRALVSYMTRTDPIYFSRDRALELMESALDASKPNMLSNESLSGPPYAGVIEAGLDHRSPILENLKTVFPDAKAILVLRRQDGLAKSLYRQYLKSGGTRSVTRFYGLGTQEQPPLFSLDRFLFTRYVDAVHAAFPAGVLLLTYEEFATDQSSFLRRIVEFSGINMPDIKIKKENATTLGPVGMEFTRFMNHFFRSLLNPAGMIPGIETSRTGHKRRISPVQILHDMWPYKKVGTNDGEIGRVAREILALSREDNRQLDARYHLDLSRFNYY